jgi:hypothetical protein
MDMVATFGEMVITEGANAANVLSAQAAPQQRDAVDTVFSGYTAHAASPLPVTLLVVAACASSINGVLMEATEPEDKEAKKTPQEILAEQQPIE